MLLNSLRTWPPCVAVGPTAQAEADEMEQGGYGKGDVIAICVDFDIVTILYEGCLTPSLLKQNRNP